MWVCSRVVREGWVRCPDKGLVDPWFFGRWPPHPLQSRNLQTSRFTSICAYPKFLAVGGVVCPLVLVVAPRHMVRPKPRHV